MRDEPLQWTTRPGSRDGVSVMELTGPLTLGNIFEFQAALAETKGPVTIVDMSQVAYMDSAGLGVLMNFYVAAEKSGRRVALACANGRICAMLDTTRVRELLRTSETVGEAAGQGRLTRSLYQWTSEMRWVRMPIGSGGVWRWLRGSSRRLRRR